MSSSINKSPVELEIVSLLQSGDRRGVSLAYKNYGDVLYGMILKVVSSEPIAQEVLQDTFVKIWKNAAQYNSGKGRLFTWFANIARNTAIDKVRSAGYRKGQKTDSMAGMTSENVAGTTQMDISDPGLKKVIDSLDEKYRLLIELSFFKGYSQREIEKEYNIPLGTVKTRLRKAVNELRIKLKSDYNMNLLLILILINALSLLLYHGY